ncbi:uncharacterized protein [Spinacia oleracea]|uniref:Uncharacterized protein LOC110774645 isoform X2 n=1 Tax=Spinacia oleracea TaxID=3562 RepID=A0A9R0HQR6_SPIOL|nr:uncharacterized protein LOC110774645 isoform X2 [Spinacia oleracea]XP_056692621.1 uncharacterized protein LOC110774645 isoform X2 [Spinacia oleracea]XP_056692622.1 uncharacterized protein LOC110774645 isoform X2 [Spinacia oleracea]
MRNFFPNSFQNIQVHVFVKRRGKEEERETLANSLFYASKSKPPIQSSAFDEVANWLGNGDPEIQASSPFEFDVVAPLGTKIKQVETRCTLWIVIFVSSGVVIVGRQRIRLKKLDWCC